MGREQTVRIRPMAHILIVDDEREVVELLKFTLGMIGYKVSTAFDGAEALAVLGIEPAAANVPLPDIVVMDMRMPVMDGLTAAGRMAADPRAKAVPVIVLTGDGGESRQVVARLPNVVGQLQKPFEPKTLRALIAEKLPPAPPEVNRA